jgi:hypothetical protein
MLGEVTLCPFCKDRPIADDVRRKIDKALRNLILLYQMTMLKYQRFSSLINGSEHILRPMEPFLQLGF